VNLQKRNVTITATTLSRLGVQLFVKHRLGTWILFLSSLFS